MNVQIQTIIIYIGLYIQVHTLKYIYAHALTNKALQNLLKTKIQVAVESLAVLLS